MMYSTNKEGISETSPGSPTQLNCSNEEARAIKDGNDAVLKQFEVKKTLTEYSKTQTSRGNKAGSTMNMTLAIVDWSGFPGAAHKTSSGESSSSERTRRRSRRKVLQAPTSVSEIEEQSDMNHCASKISTLKISRRRLASIGGSSRALNKHSDDPFNKPASSQQYKYRRTSSKNLTDCQPISSSSETVLHVRSRDRRSQCQHRERLNPRGSSDDSGQTLRRGRTNPGDENQDIPSTRSQRNLISRSSRRNHTAKGSINRKLTSPPSTSTKRLRPMLTATASSRGLVAASSTTLEVTKKKTPSKAKSRQRQGDFMGSELKKQSSMRW